MQFPIHRGHGRRVSALVYALVDQRRQDREFLNSNISTNAIVQFVLEQQLRMPDYLRFPIKFATWLHAVDAFKNHFNLYVKLSVPGNLNCNSGGTLPSLHFAILSSSTKA